MIEPLNTGNGYFSNRINDLMQEPLTEAVSYRKSLEKIISQATQERPKSLHLAEDYKITLHPKNNTLANLTAQEINTGRQLAREAQLSLQNYPTAYYDDLKTSISELQSYKEKHRTYLEEAESSEKPQSYLHLIEKIQTPLPLKIFTESFPTPESVTTQETYLNFEISVLNKLRNVNQSHLRGSVQKEAENYELHQQRIINTLKTINNSEPSLRLAFINLYLQANALRIKQESASVEKEALLAKTVKFLDANLISPTPHSFSSEEKAKGYANLLVSTISYVKEINQAFSLNNSSLFAATEKDNTINPLFLFKSLLTNKILDQGESVIAINNLSLATKKDFLANRELTSLLGEEPSIELKNKLLQYILKQKNFSSPYGDSLNGGNPSRPNQESTSEQEFKFIYDENVSGKNYNQEDLFRIILKNLRESKNDRPFFFKFLDLMIGKTTKAFTEFKDNEIPNDRKNEFKEFKNLLLNHFEQPTRDISQNSLTYIAMGKSLIKLMQFKDDDIKEAAKTFYLKALKEAKYLSGINALLEPLSIMQNSHSDSISPLIDDSLPITKGDLTQHLQQNNAIRKQNTEKYLEGMMPNIALINTPTEDEEKLSRYAKILNIDLYNPKNIQNLYLEI